MQQVEGLPAAAVTAVVADAVLPTSQPLPAEVAVDLSVVELGARISLARAGAGVPALSWSPQLAHAASLHAQDMATLDFVSHTGSDGSDLLTRVKRSGYDPTWRGEIIVSVSGGPEVAFGWWWDSQIHHDTMLGAAYRDIGIGHALHPTQTDRSYFVAVFGRR